MSVVIETTLGDITVDLYLSQRPRACLNFLKLCKTKYYNFNLFHTISRGFIAQTGDPTGSRSGGESIFGLLEGQSKRFFEGENEPRIKHTKMGLISFVGNEERMIGSQFFITLGEDITYLDEKHCVFGEVVEGYDILEVINEVICDTDDRPYQDVRITHMVILDDPYPDPKTLRVPSRSPSPNAERLQGGRIAPDEDIDETEGKNVREIAEMQADREAKARATILEMVGDLPDADMAPPENVLFVCKLNPVTTDDDLEIIFNRFGKVKSCEVIRDRKTNDSLQYAFIEFEDEKSCEEAYFKMDNILIDDRRIHVDFSQSVSKIKWHGKGRGATHYDDKGKRAKDNNNEIERGDYKVYSREKRESSRNNNSSNNTNSQRNKRDKSYSKSPTRNKDKSEKLRVEQLSKTEKDNRRMQYKTSRRMSRSRSRSPKRQSFKSRSPDRRNYRRLSPRRRITPMSSAYGNRNRNTNYSKNRNRSRSPSDSSLTSRYSNEKRRYKTSSQSNHDERYSKSESRRESSNHFRREEIQSERYHFSDKKEQYINEFKENSHKKGIKSSEDSEAENKNRNNKEPNPMQNYSNAEVEKKAINQKESKSSRDLQRKNKNQKKIQKYRKNSSKNEEKAKKKKKKSKESSDSSSDSSSSDSSSDSSSSESSDSSSESDSSDSEVERRKKRKSKKRSKKTTDESSDSDSSIGNKPKKKKKKPQSSDSDSEESSRKKAKKMKKK